jgi:hypothetical protein
MRLCFSACSRERRRGGASCPWFSEFGESPSDYETDNSQAGERERRAGVTSRRLRGRDTGAHIRRQPCWTSLLSLRSKVSVMADPSRHLRSLLTPQAGWHLNLYPGAFEAGGSFQAARRATSTYVPGMPAADPERARQEAGRRARTRLRRYCVANGLNGPVTLTYEESGCHHAALTAPEALMDGEVTWTLCQSGLGIHSPSAGKSQDRHSNHHQCRWSVLE